MKKYNILVVEDDEVDVMNIKRAFEKSGVSNKINYAKDGQEAIEFILKQNPNDPYLILLDINMPRMNGIDFLKELRKNNNWKLTPVIMLTTSSEEKDKIESYKLSVVGYIVKPVIFSNFIEAVSAVKVYWTLSEFPRN